MLPSLMRTPVDTAGLKCPPVTPPNMTILHIYIRPMQTGCKAPLSMSALMLTAVMRKAVPINSYMHT